MNNYCRKCLWYNAGCPDLLDEDVSCSILDELDCDHCEHCKICSKCSVSCCCDCILKDEHICDR